MISVLLLGFDVTGRQAASPADAVRTLAALVPATVNGVVRDLCLTGPANSALVQVADHAGCTFVPVATLREAFAAGARQLRQPQVLVAHAGLAVDRAVIEELATLLPLFGDPDAPAWMLRADRRDLIGRVFPASAPLAGLVCPRTMLLHADVANLATLARRTMRRRIMKATALPGP